MAASLLNPRTIKKTTLYLTFRLFPNTSFSSYSLFSSLCRRFHPISSPSQNQTQKPPSPKKVPFTVSVLGRTWEDPYHWMRNTNDPDFIEYLSQENSYAEEFMADTQKIRRTLFSEMKSRMPAEVSTPPERWGPWLYYQHIPEGKEYPVLCRRVATEQKGWAKTVINYLSGGGFEREEILLDWNEIAEQYGYVHVGTCRVSPDHNFLAYTLDITGSEKFMLQIKDLTTGHILPKLRVDGVVSLAWAQDGCTLFYTVSDENQRSYRVLCTKLGSDSMFDVPVFTENDSSFFVDIASTKDGKFITVNSNSRTSSEVYTIDASNPQDGLQKLRKRVPGVKYFVEHHCGFFYILTNASLSEDKELSTGNYYLGRLRVEDTHLDNWQDIILPSEGSSLQDMDIFNGHLVLFIGEKDSTQICSINLPIDVNCKHCLEVDDLAPWFFPLPSNLCTFSPGSNHDFMSSVYRVVLSSPAMADVIVDYDMSSLTFSIVHKEEVLGVSATSGSFSQTSETEVNEFLDTSKDNQKRVRNDEVWTWKDFSDAYLCERKEVISCDGVGVPLTIVYSRTTHKKDQSPGLLLGYGAYGEVLDKSWSSDRLSLLDRGWVVAFADVRGGAGFDPSWHKSGTGLHKLNSIHDFVSCGKYLVNKGYVHTYKLGAVGDSAGSLLVGAAINMYPELFRAAILKVPFLDMCNTLLDPTLPLTILDYEEFGNPQIRPQLESILHYSPYDNIPERVCCPPVLVKASFHDSRVGVWEAAKWVAKVRDTTCSSCSCSVILKTNMSGGHFGEGGRFGHCEEMSYEYAFLMKAMGIWDQRMP
ncbi:Protease [Actinidia chinensis var. chinensis]|uniref:Prolyl endopeptidase n=1 Tax=Actinidia chinensis var. chinensis TaxID=1590841 RepID=A0A2R6PB38_ACTCC|nr:Protease [Actinidia chinensis var. chinensis]